MIQNFGPRTPDLDPSVWVHPSAVLIGQVRLAAGVSIWPTAVLRGDMGLISVARDSNVQDGVVVHMTSDMSETHVGERVTVGHRAVLHGCRVGNDCIVGMGAILLDNCRIPDNCIVGAGSLVPVGREYPENSLILGSPARVVRELKPKDHEWIAYSWKHYQEAVEIYRAQ